LEDRSEIWDEQRHTFNKDNVADSIGAWCLVGSELVYCSLDLLVGDGPEFAYWGAVFIVGVNEVVLGGWLKEHIVE
jgi:hypothetical protein